MDYKIEYTPMGIKKSVYHDGRSWLTAIVMVGMVLFAVHVWHNREAVLQMATAFEQMAADLKQGSAVTDVFTAFNDALEGGICG